jgi:hypothetical protein
VIDLTVRDCNWSGPQKSADNVNSAQIAAVFSGDCEKNENGKLRQDGSTYLSVRVAFPNLLPCLPSFATGLVRAGQHYDEGPDSSTERTTGLRHCLQSARWHFRYGLFFRLQLLPTLSVENAVTFDYRAETFALIRTHT